MAIASGGGRVSSQLVGRLVSSNRFSVVAKSSNLVQTFIDAQVDAALLTMIWLLSLSALPVVSYSSTSSP